MFICIQMRCILVNDGVGRVSVQCSSLDLVAQAIQPPCKAHSRVVVGALCGTLQFESALCSVVCWGEVCWKPFAG